MADLGIGGPDLPQESLCVVKVLRTSALKRDTKRWNF